MGFDFLYEYWLIFAGIFVVGGTIITYNNLTSKKNRVEKSLSNIDIFLQQRMDQMENLFTLLDNALDHETKMFDEISKARIGFNQIKEMYQFAGAGVVEADQAMSSFLSEARLTFEKYPELKAINIVGDVIVENIQIETQINASRRQYNSNVTLYRNAIRMFPHVIIASMFRFTDNYELYRADDAAKRAVRPRSRVLGHMEMKHCLYCNTDYNKIELRCPSCHATDFEIRT